MTIACFVLIVESTDMIKSMSQRRLTFAREFPPWLTDRSLACGQARIQTLADLKIKMPGVVSIGINY
jgi:hypothetical protein